MADTLTFYLARISTPIGPMLIAIDDQDRLRVLDWDSHAERMQGLLDRYYGKGAARLVDGPATGPVADKLEAYFAGDIAAIDDIATKTAGTPFQRQVWAALREIPAGDTWSYGRLAAHIGRPAAVRAVGLANGANPDRGRGALPPRHRRRWQPDRLRRRPRAQEVAARARRRRFTDAESCQLQRSGLVFPPDACDDERAPK